MSRRIYLQESVLDAALTRMRWVFKEFEHVSVNFSGGKDSTVVLNLALQVATELGRLPLEVLFVDQEAEWDAVIRYVRQVMADPRVKPRWLQVPFRLFNATSPNQPWLECWAPGQQWMREREPNSEHVNVYGNDRFAKMFEAVQLHDHPAAPAARLAGVRCEESPARALGLTTYETYKGETWGTVEDKRRHHYTFYPLYDWSYTDVWKAIHDHGWPYCTLYDAMYQHGVPTRSMRVSNVHHETAVPILLILQAIEPRTWDRLTERLAGANTVKHLAQQWFCPDTLPPMFASWAEYRDHLLDNLITDPAKRDTMRRQFALEEGYYEHPSVLEALVRTEIGAILVNDFELTKLLTFRAAHLDAFKNRGSHQHRTGRPA